MTGIELSELKHEFREMEKLSLYINHLAIPINYVNKEHPMYLSLKSSSPLVLKSSKERI